MKTKPAASLLILPCMALFSFASSAAADTTTDAPEEPAFAPKGFPLSRYDHLDKKSPFEFEPAKEATVVAEDPFKDISLAGYCGSGNTMTVYLISGKEKKRISVYGDGSAAKKRDQSGYRVIGIKRGRTLKTTAITLEKDGVTKDVMFEEETLRPKGGAAPGQQPAQQMVPGPNGQMVPRPVIPRPGGAMGQPQQPYQAPQAFIPGQNNPAQPQVGVPQVPQPGAVAGQNIGNMTNQQLVNHLVGPGGQPPVTPGVVQPQATQVTGGGEHQRPPGQPSRRRVVLPTQQ